MILTLRRLGFVLLAAVVAGAGFSVTTAVASHQFSDVPNSHPFHADIDWLVDHGIVSGSSPTFKPGDPLTRARAARFFRNYNASLHVVNDGGTFTAVTQHTNTATCPAGERPLSAWGSTNQVGVFITDIVLGPNSATVRWESDDNTSVSGSSNTGILCGPNP